jgi:hypothetical protein
LIARYDVKLLLRLIVAPSGVQERRPLGELLGQVSEAPVMLRRYSIPCTILLIASALLDITPTVAWWTLPDYVQYSAASHQKMADTLYISRITHVSAPVKP